MARTGFDLELYVPYLMRRTTDILIEMMAAGLKEHDLTLPMWRVLAVLRQRGATRFGTLARITLIEPPTLTRVIRALTTRGFAVKTSSDVDGRGVLIASTKKGRDVVKQIVPHAMEVEKSTLAGLTEDEAELFRRLLRRVCANVAPFIPDHAGRD